MELITYLEEFGHGTALRLAKKIGATPVLISQWKMRRRQIPPKRCPDIERATHGLVTCEELRPDVDWAYLRGTSVPSASDSTVRKLLMKCEKKA